jgi:hypothetical protein
MNEDDNPEYENERWSDREKRRLIGERDRLVNDPGGGLYSDTHEEFVLSEPTKNLWEGIRADAIDYFDRNSIRWWRERRSEPTARNEPTGHMLSSQIACVNHLYFLRQRPDLVKAVLKAIDSEVVEAEVVDDGYVEFEFIGDEQYLMESQFARGAYCTSIDAFMIGRTARRDRRAFLVEWKYIETYGRDDKYNCTQARVYDDLIAEEVSPFDNNRIKPRNLYFDQFYQMMRQTLLGWQLAKHQDHDCTSYCNILVVPEQNVKFHRNVTAPLDGTTVSEAWRRVLRRPRFFISTTPVNFMRPVVGHRDTKTLTTYLERRYWSGR